VAKERKKHEYSKLVVDVVGVVAVEVLIFTQVMIWRTNDLSPLIYLIPSVGAVVATIVAFYMRKAQVENRIKLMKKHNLDSSVFDDLEGDIQ
jgi:hypothetical protein